MAVPTKATYERRKFEAGPWLISSCKGHILTSSCEARLEGGCPEGGERCALCRLAVHFKETLDSWTVTHSPSQTDIIIDAPIHPSSWCTDPPVSYVQVHNCTGAIMYAGDGVW